MSHDAPPRTVATGAGAGTATMVRDDAPWEPVHRQFSAVAAATPARPAVVAPAGRLSYRQLERRSDLVAEALLARGVSTDAVVGLSLARGPAMVSALLGVLKAGAAYLPLDPSYPGERLRYMVADSGATVVLTDASAPARLFRSVDVLGPGEWSPRSAGSRHVAPACPPVRPGNLAYVIYTSGSTGRPKPVQVTHASLAGLLDALRGAGVAGDPDSVVAWNASLSFDASVQQWVRLCDGACLVLLDERLRSDPVALARSLTAHGVTDLDITPTHLGMLVGELPSPPPGQRPLRLLVGGEAIRPGLWETLAGLARAGTAEAVNLYGTTECTVDSTVARVEQAGAPHLGGPLPGVRCHVLDERWRPVGPGEAGELFVAGWGLARGYGGRPALTAQRFVPDPFAADGSRMYRTGDRVRRTAGGTLEFLGRVDHQVKLRGFRIELGEIEAVLSQADPVDAAVVVLRDDVPAGPQLVAYCRPASTPVDELRDWAAARLPDYMVPAVFVPCDAFPVNGSGKVDRDALPPPDAPAAAGADEEDFVAPAGEFEEMIAAIWCEVLGAARVSATDDFYHIGGNSLLALQVAATLRRRTGLALPMTTVVRHTKLTDLAGQVAGVAGAASTA